MYAYFLCVSVYVIVSVYVYVYMHACMCVCAFVGMLVHTELNVVLSA